MSWLAFGAGLLDGRRVALARVDETHAIELTGDLFADGTLDRLLAAGRGVWDELSASVPAMAGEPIDLERVRLGLPFAVADYVDFYASEQHATNVGRIFRPDGDALTPNWKHLPIGYHGRAGTVIASGTGIRRPNGQRREADATIGFGPSQRLDIEAEVAFVVGVSSPLGEAVPVENFREHVFGVCLLNDWSARDIQAWEYVPLGPFLGKSFATSVSPWITPLSAFDHDWTAPPPRDPQPLPYLDDSATPAALDLQLEIRLNGELISSPPFASMYWTPAQMLAHLTVNGASLRTGDLYASGTVSGSRPDQYGSLLELTWGGTRPLTLGDGSTRTFLHDGDVVTISAVSHSGVRLGEVAGQVFS